ncbi:MAG: hypothetical protein KO202_07570 [Methanobacteriaceae archaeon]|jgi:recombinational DNA repair ATPase RecF|nr:hypothetical protein [Methanobacteriaceae archaeon]
MTIKLNNIIETKKDNEKINADIKKLKELIDYLNDNNNFNDNIKEFNSDYLKNTKKNLESIKIKLEISDNDKKRYQLIEKLTLIKSKILDIKKTEEELLINTKQLNYANNLYIVFKSTKNNEIQLIFEDIKKDLEEFYNFIHPNESNKDIELIVDDSKNIVNLKINSFNQGKENPRVYSSEGHLDTLGLCIFLAFVKRFNNNIPYILLDDVVTTVDAKHRERIAKLLFSKFSDKQFIITTHDKLWYRQMSQMIGPYSLNSKNFKI